MITGESHNNFSLLRLALALMVVFGHFKTLPGLSPATGFFGYADFAVDAFFVVSGYLIASSYDKQPQLVGYGLRRFFRIYPLYLTVVLLQAAAMLALLPEPLAHYWPNAARYLAVNGVFANFMQYDIGGLLQPLHNPGINPSLWTLKIEVGFYLVLPIVWWLLRRWGVAVLVLVYLASTALAYWAQHYGTDALAKQLPCQMRFFVIGIACYRYGDRLRLSPPVTWGLVAVLFALCSWRAVLPIMALYPVFIGLWVYLVALRLPALPLKFDISFGVYLVHGPLIQLSLLTGLFTDTLGFLAMLLAAVLTLAVVAEHAVERPGIALGKKLVRRFAPAKPAGAVS